MNKRTGILAASLVAAIGISAAIAAQVPAVAAAPAAAQQAPVMPLPRHHGMMAGKRVANAQQALNAAGAKLTVDGKWGPKTEAALKQFQQQHGLKVTGHLDHATRTQLKHI